jgi:uncharacterized repeat protein (TIGR01451 family)
VAAFARNTSTGALTQLGCVVEPQSVDASCALGRGLVGAGSVVVSPDKANVYTASNLNNPVANDTSNTGSSAIAAFARTLTADVAGSPPTFGTLSQLSGGDGCVSSQSGTDGCALARALQQPGFGPHSLALSPTGSFLYAAAATSQSVAAFGRQGSDLRLSALADPGPYVVGQAYNLVITVLNAGALPADHVTLTDAMSSGAAILSATPSQGSCAINLTVCSLGTIPVNGSATVTIRFQPTASGTFTNTARVGADQGDAAPADNIVTLSLATGTASRSPSPSATPTATISPSGRQHLGLSLTSPSTIKPGQASNWRGTGTAGQAVTLRCYSRTPANSQPGMGTPAYFSARDGVLGSTGVVGFSLSPGTNTRCFLRYRDAQDTDAMTSNSVAQQVATALSLSAYRDGVRRYHFQGTNLPRRPGQLITLYRYATGPNLDKYCVPGQELYTPSVGGSCVAVRTATAYTNSTNVWRIDRAFSGSGQFYFVARTSSTLTNVAGFSNQRLTIIH